MNKMLKNIRENKLGFKFWGVNCNSDALSFRHYTPFSTVSYIGGPFQCFLKGNDFLAMCYSFNQPLDLSNLMSVGNAFLSTCYSFNQPLDTSNLTSVGAYFLTKCYALTDLEWNCSVYPTDDNSLSQDINTKTSASGTGIKITGTNAQGLINALPDRTSSPYRKLILGGE